MTAAADVVTDTPAESGEQSERFTPRWLDLVVQWAALGVVSVGVVGLPLLLVGLYKSYLVLPLAIVVWLVLVVLRARSRPVAGAKATLTTHIVSGAAVIVAIVDFIVNAKESTQHLLADGDPSIYGLTGKWIAEHGTLNIPIHPDWFGNDQTVNYMTNGFFLRPDGHHLYPQFFHLLPALLAIGDWFDGTGGLLHLNMLIGAFALLAIFAFATRFMHPVWALAMMVTLSLTLPQVFFSRDTFSEIPSQFLVFAGLAMLCDTIARKPSRPGIYGLLAGLTLGASTMARIDAFTYLPPILLALVVLALRATRTKPAYRDLVRIGTGAFIGLALTGAIGTADAIFGSPAYAKSVKASLAAIAVLTILVVIAGVVVFSQPKVRGFVVRAGAFLPRLARIAAGLVALGLFAAWLLRPHVQTSHETGVLDISNTLANLQRAEHVTLDPTRHYNEMSLRWLSWYLGPITLTVAIIGFGYLTYRVFRGKDLKLLPFWMLAGPVTLLYVYDPQIVPVQYWATRRFVPVTLPALLLLAFFVMARLFDVAWARFTTRSSSDDGERFAGASVDKPAIRWVSGVVAVGLAIAMVVTPIVLLGGPVRLVRSYIPIRDETSRICAALTPTDAVLLVGGGSAANGFVQTIEIYCGNSAAVAGTRTEMADIVTMSKAAAASGHRLMLMSSQQQPTDDSGKPLGVTLGTTVDGVVFDTEALSLTHRPDHDFKVNLPIFITPAPAQ